MYIGYSHPAEPAYQNELLKIRQSFLAALNSLENMRDEIYTYALQCIKKSNTAPSDVLFCKKITDYLEQHYTEPDLSVSGIAEIFHLHPSYLGTVFKKVHHTSILQYLADIRIAEAKKLLCEKELKISEIAEATGFSDVYYFSKKFKKICGKSPKEYAAEAKTEMDFS